jgi:hypothetical protein
MSLKDWFQERFSKDRRKADRQASPQLVAFYWDGSPPMPHSVRDISSTGLYLITEGRWYPGTLVMMTLQEDGTEVDGEGQSISVEAKVVRVSSDGVGLAFILPKKQGTVDGRNLMPNVVDKKTFDKFVQQHLVPKDGV